MRSGTSITASPIDDPRLRAPIDDRNAARRQVRRAEIVLLSAGAPARMRSCAGLESQDLCPAFAGPLRPEGLRRPPARRDPLRASPRSASKFLHIIAVMLKVPRFEVTHRRGATNANAVGVFRTSRYLDILRATRPTMSWYIRACRTEKAPVAKTRSFRRRLKISIEWA